MKSLAACLCLFALTPAAGAEDVIKLPISIFCANYVDDLKSVFVKSGDHTFRAIGLSTANVIDAGELDVVEGKISIHGPAGGDASHPVGATAAVAGIKEPLVVLAPATKEDGAAYQSTVVECASDKFPMGVFLFVNLSPHSVRVTMGEDVLEIEGGAVNPFKPKAKAGEVFPVTIDYQTGDAWLLMSSARWAARDDRRTLVCIQLDPTSKRMMVKSVPLREKSK